MKIEEYVPAAESTVGLNTTARIPFVSRGAFSEPFWGREELVLDAREFGKTKETSTNEEVKHFEAEFGLKKPLLVDDAATASVIAKQGLIKEYTENLKQVDLGDLEQVMQELRQDRMLQKYQYFVGDK